MGDFDEIFRATKKLVLTLKDQLTQLESGRDTSLQLRSDANENLKQVQTGLDRLKLAVQRVPPTQVAIASRRIEILAAEANDIAASFRAAMRALGEKEERHQLLGDAYVERHGDTAMLVEAIDGSTTRSLVAASEIQEMGRAIVADMRTQRDLLLRARQRLYDLMGSVGASATVLRLLQRRDRTDRLLVYLGMLVISVILLAAYWFLRR